MTPRDVVHHWNAAYNCPKGHIISHLFIQFSLSQHLKDVKLLIKYGIMVWMYNQRLKWRGNWEIKTAVRISLVKWPHEKSPNSFHFIPFPLCFSWWKRHMCGGQTFHQLCVLTMSSKDQAQVIRLVGKQPYVLSHFTSPLANFKMFKINMKQIF